MVINAVFYKLSFHNVNSSNIDCLDDLDMFDTCFFLVILNECNTFFKIDKLLI